jgi:hypothetical protein
MARIAAAADGTILRFVHSAALEAQYPNPPAGTDESLSFDERSNAALVADLGVSTDPYRLQGGVLTKNDTPVVIAAESAETVAVREFGVQYAAVLARMEEIADDPTATDLAGEVRGAVRDVARVTARLMRYLKAQAT